MDVRQVALGAVFGAAVAVNAALQSLQDAGSFLIQGPSSDSSKHSSLPLPHPSVAARPRKRAMIKSAEDLQHEQASFFRDFLNDVEIDDGGAFEASESDEELLTPLSATTTTPSIDTSAAFFQQDLSVFENNSLEVHQGPKKLQVKRKSMEASPKDKYNTECYLKASDEENSSTEDGDGVWDHSNSLMHVQTTTKRRVQRPMFMPLLPQMVQSEESMSAMLQHTTNTVLETLSEAKEQREQMLENVQRVNLPEEQISLQLMSRFIDALINVSESLQIVHSALFPGTDDPQSRS